MKGTWAHERCSVLRINKKIQIKATSWHFHVHWHSYEEEHRRCPVLWGQLGLTHVSEEIRQWCSYFRKRFLFQLHHTCSMWPSNSTPKLQKRMCANNLYMGVNDVIHSSSKARHSSNVHQLTNEKANWVCAYNVAQRWKEATLKDTRLTEGLRRRLGQRSGRPCLNNDGRERLST